jgi:hypothetical protein
VKYLCLAYCDEKKFNALSKTELDAVVSECQPYDEALRKSGHLLATGSLQPTRTATTVRARNGKVSITDGPFAETKEQVGGFFIIEAGEGRLLRHGERERAPERPAAVQPRIVARRLA